MTKTYHCDSKSKSPFQWKKFLCLLIISILVTITKSLWTIGPNTPITLFTVIKVLGPLIFHIIREICKDYPSNITGPSSTHFLVNLTWTSLFIWILTLASSVEFTGHSTSLATILFELSIITLVTLFTVLLTLLVRATVLAHRQ